MDTVTAEQVAEAWRSYLRARDGGVPVKRLREKAEQATRKWALSRGECDEVLIQQTVALAAE